MNSYTAVAIAAAFPIMLGPAVAQQPQRQAAPVPTFEFRGHHVGEAIDTAFPHWREDKDGPDFRGGCLKEHRLGDGFIACIEMAVELGPVQAQSIIYYYNAGRLYGVVLSAPPNSFRVLQTLLVGRYGTPQFAPNPLSVGWRFREGNLYLTDIGRSSVLEFEKQGMRRVLAPLEQAWEQEKARQAQLQREAAGQAAFGRPREPR
jgi:hypothetical protein